MRDIVVHAFSKRQAKGETFFNPMDSRIHTVSIQAGNGPHLRKKDAVVCSPDLSVFYEVRSPGPWFLAVVNINHGFSPANPILPGGVISSSDIANLQVEISTKCLAKRGTSSNNLFESVAEYRKTLAMLRNPLKSFNRFFSKNEKAIRRLKSAADAWLQYRYGVRPLIKDIVGIFEGLEQKVGVMRVTTRAQGEISRNAESTHTYDALPGVLLTYGIQKTDVVKVRAMSLDEYFVSRSERIGFTGKGLLTVPWELVPYSFVADWFVNLGDYLNALVPLPSLKQLGSCLTTERIVQNIYSPLFTDCGPTYNVVGSVTGLLVSSVRTKVRSSLLPAGIVVRNDFRFEDATRLADSAALILQKMNSLFRKR
jgi:hypothetical protein